MESALLRVMRILRACRPRERKGQSMKLMVRGFLVIASLLSLSACAYLRPVGPCYGVGCPAFSSAAAPQPAKSAALSQPPAAKNKSAKSFAAKIKDDVTHAPKSDAAKQPPANPQPTQGN